MLLVSRQIVDGRCQECERIAQDGGFPSLLYRLHITVASCRPIATSPVGRRWTPRNFDLADELMGDTVIRHDVGEAQTLTHEQAVRRVVGTSRSSTSRR